MIFLIFFAFLASTAFAQIPLNSGALISNYTEHPWIALLFIKEPQSTNEFICGGSLVGSEWILTAAHCVYPGNSGLLSTSITAFLHETYVRAGGSWYTLPTVSSVQIIPHPQYDPTTFTNDVALVKINKSITTILPLRFTFSLSDWQDLLKQVPLPSLTQIGYGKSSPNSDAGNDARKIQMQPLAWSPGGGCGGWDRTVVHGDYCAINRTPINGIIQQPCGGDSGSALFADTKPPIGYAIVSRGEDKCGDGTLPNIFSGLSQTSMTSFLNQYISAGLSPLIAAPPHSFSPPFPPLVVASPSLTPSPPPPAFEAFQNTFFSDWFPSGYAPRKITLVFIALCILSWH